MQPIYYDSNKCMSIRSRRIMIQCCYDKKENSDYCGIHTRSQNVIRIDSILGTVPMDAPMDALGNSRYSGIELKSFIFR